MKFSHGDALTAGSANTILTVPAGYDAIITYLFISNTTGSSKNIDARWVHNSVNIDFLAGKNVGSNEFLEFGGQSGEFLVAKKNNIFIKDLTTSFKLYQHGPDSELLMSLIYILFLVR